jgi:hypothetical protein
MVGYSQLFGSVLGFVTKNIEQLCEERNRSSHFLPFFIDQKPETTVLITTAREYFQNKFDFKEAKRSDYDERLANSPEWNLPRCSSAVFMTLKLDPKDDPIS